MNQLLLDLELDTTYSSRMSLQVLESAREYFIRHGGAQGMPTNTRGQVCAGQAVVEIVGYGAFGDKPFLALSDAAYDLFGTSIIQVNDKLGKKAALECYDYAIKQLKEEIGNA